MGQSLDAQAVSTHATHSLSPPLKDIPVGPAAQGPEFILPAPVAGEPPQPAAPVTDPVIQSTPGPLVGTLDLMNFPGLGRTGGTPPDPNGAPSDTQYMQWVNSRFGIFDKATGDLLLAAPGSTIFGGMGCPCESDHGDGIILYDKAAGRWVLSQLANPTTCGDQARVNVCVAVSSTSDATGTWNRYRFDMSGVWPSDTTVPDYPKWGVWPDAYYYTANIFAQDSSHSRTGICAFDRANMLAGNDATSQCFLVQTGPVGVSYLPADLDGSTPPPDGSPNPLIDINNSGQELRIVNFHVDWDNPANSTLTGPVHIPVAPFTRASGTVPQLGTDRRLDTLGDRVMFRLAYRNFGDHEALVVNHSVQDPMGITGMRWYEVRDPNGSPAIYQQGTFMPDSTYRWMGSIAMDQAGDIALGYSASTDSINPEIRYTGRTPDDELGTLEDENCIISGTGSQTTSSRWGDYSSMTIDPVDDCTFWYTNEYYDTDGGNWKTRIASFQFSKCVAGSHAGSAAERMRQR
jgi:hypothetical protein